jgi:hypothetical protein
MPIVPTLMAVIGHEASAFSTVIISPPISRHTHPDQIPTPSNNVLAVHDNEHTCSNIPIFSIS